MRFILLSLIFHILIVSCKEDKRDYRAELNVEGEISEISVSPDEKIWLTTALGYTYYTTTIDSNWHISSEQNGMLDRISFFNHDTAIMTGQIYYKNETGTNALYLTEDGGVSWKQINFGGDTRIYDVFTDSVGNAWMGGSSGEIFYSGNFGQNWKKLNSPLRDAERLENISMINQYTGIASSEYGLYITQDNWKNSIKIMTPFELEQSSGIQKSKTFRIINQSLIWNNYIVILQSGKVYYSSLKDPVHNWKILQLRATALTIDKSFQKLYVVTKDSGILQFTSPEEKFTSFYKKPLPVGYKGLTAANNSLYFFKWNTKTYKHDIYKVTENKIQKAGLYTYDEKIKEPRIVKKGKNLFWGIHFNNLYLFDLKENKWFREKELDFSMRNISLVDDSSAVLTDYEYNNYIYSLKDHSLKKYTPKSLFTLFLNAPIQSLQISASSNGCFHYFENKILYTSENSQTLQTNNYQKFDSSTEDKRIPFQQTIPTKKVIDILNIIQANLSFIPGLKDFKITPKDISRYLSLYNSHHIYTGNYYNHIEKIEKSFYDSIPLILDRLPQSVFYEVLNQTENIISTTNNNFIIEIVNQKNDTIYIFKQYYGKTKTLHLPWNIRVNDFVFKTYHPELSRFVSESIPDDFKDKAVFDNAPLLIEIAYFLWQNKQK